MGSNFGVNRVQPSPLRYRPQFATDPEGGGYGKGIEAGVAGPPAAPATVVAAPAGGSETDSGTGASSLVSGKKADVPGAAEATTPNQVGETTGGIGSAGVYMPVGFASDIAGAPSFRDRIGVNGGNDLMPRDRTESMGKGGQSSGLRERTYEEMYRELWPQPDPEKERKQRKLEAVQTLAARMYDAFSSLGNMAATAKYAPHKYESAGDRTHEAAERARQLREAAKSQWWNTYIQARGLDANAAAAKAAAEMAEREFGLKVGELELKEKDLLIKAAEAQARGETEKARTLLLLAQMAKEQEEAKWVGPKAKSEIGRNNATAGAQSALAGKYNADATATIAELSPIVDENTGRIAGYGKGDSVDAWAGIYQPSFDVIDSETTTTTTTGTSSGGRSGGRGGKTTIKTSTSTKTKQGTGEKSMKSRNATAKRMAEDKKNNGSGNGNGTNGRSGNNGKGKGKGSKGGGNKNGGWASGLTI